jgi:hypothetical protein
MRVVGLGAWCDYVTEEEYRRRLLAGRLPPDPAYDGSRSRAFSAGRRTRASRSRRRSAIDEKKDESPHWVPLQPSHYLYTGLFPQYCLAQVQGVLDDLDVADEVLVKFTPEDE